MKKFGKAILIFAIALASSSVVTRRVAARVLGTQDSPSASAYVSGASTAQAFSADESQDREQEKRAREQEAPDREQEKRDRAQEAKDRAQEKLDQQQQMYERGTEALDQGDWQRAQESFTEVASRGGSSAEGALYWKAYAQNKLGHRAEALSTLGELTKSSPHSRWAGEAKQLELEIRQNSGQKVSPDDQSGDELKLMALNGLMNSDPDRALPMLEKFLQGNQSPKLKERALFVLSQSSSPRAREVVAKIARGNANPDLQMKALNELGLFGGHESRQMLADIYASSSDDRIKRAILRSFMIGGDRDRLFAVAKSEKSADLRREAIQQLALTGAHSELWDLYQAEPTAEVKRQILRSLFLTGNADKLIEVARNEKDSSLRRAAIQSLGLMGKSKTGDALVSVYASEKDAEVKGAVINAYFIQGNAQPLIDIARREKDPELKRDAVQKLSLMGSKEATDYLMEILNK